MWQSRRCIMVNGVPGEVPRDSIHHVTAKAFSHIFILLSSGTSKEGFLALPRREYQTQYYLVEAQTLVELNPKILVRHVERMMMGVTAYYKKIRILKVGQNIDC